METLIELVVAALLVMYAVHELAPVWRVAARGIARRLAITAVLSITQPEAPSVPERISMGQVAAPESEQQRAEGGRTKRHQYMWSTVSIALGLFILALAVRWWGLPAQDRAMWGDEAQLLIEARKFIQGVYTTPFIVDHLSLPALYEYLLSFPLRLASSVD